MDAQPNLRRNAFVIIGGVLLIFLLVWLWRYYHTGTIIITTDDAYNKIVLTKTNDGNVQAAKQSFKADEDLSVTTSSGKYVVSVTGNSVATIQTIDLKPRATLRYTINPIHATGVEPVAYENTRAITATTKQLTYIDLSSDENNNSNTLHKIDSQNNIKEIDSDHQFQAVKWASSSFGVGQDYGRQLYVVTNGAVSPLKVPFNYGGKVVNFDVSSSKKIFVSYGKDVYAGDRNGNFKKIYTASTSKPTLAAGGNQVAVADTRYGKNASSISESLLATINVSGKESKKNIESERLAWSPNGQYLAGVNEANPVIYNAALHTVAVVPTKSVVGQLVWLNNSTLLYSVNDELWTYDLAGQKAQLLANMPLSNSITGLYISDDKSYVYLTTFDSYYSVYAIKRIGLRGQKVPDYIYRLQDIMPVQGNNYSLSLVNFSGQPEIIVNQTPGNKSTQDVLQSAINDLRGKGFDTSKLRFEIEQVES